MRLTSLALAIVPLLCACRSESVPEADLGIRIPSPSGHYILGAGTDDTEGSPKSVIIRLRAPSGKLLDTLEAELPAGGKWALGWHQGEDAIVLQRGTATTVYNVRPSGKIQLMECPKPVYGDTGRRLIELKYPGQTTGQGEPAASAKPAQ